MSLLFKKNNNTNDQTGDSGKQKLPEGLRKIVGMKVPISSKPVYYIESPTDETVLVAINPGATYNEDGTAEIEWFDTIKDRCMIAVSTQKKGDCFAFAVDAGDGKCNYYYMCPMNLRIYNERVKDHLIGHKEFDNEEDMIQAFLETGAY